METASSLQVVLTDSIIRSLAGERFYQRGVDYFRRNRVVELAHAGDVLEATVSGTEDYGVRIFVSGQRFEYMCECPLGDEGQFCKHCVATALAWLADQSAPAPKKPRPKPITDADIAVALGSQSKDDLIATLMAWSQRDKALRQRLVLMARARTSPADLVAEVRAQVQKAIKIHRFIDCHEARSYQSRVEEALESVGNLIEQGHAESMIELCESAIGWLEAAVGNIDDSDGQITDLMELVAAYHLKACDKARPEPAALGARLFALEMSGNYGEWSNTPEKYAHLLGETGLAAFRDAAAKAWAKVPVRTVRESRTSGESYYAITAIMKSLARQSGDVEQVVAVLERDLTFAMQYLHIANAYRDAAKPDKALHWAERGMALYPGCEGGQLRRFVAEEYRRLERHADALRILWSEFRAMPTLESYATLESFALAADDWDDWRDRALSHIRRVPAEKFSGPAHRSRSLLVEIFLHEGKVDEAWAEAKAGGCSDSLWLRLAAKRGKTHPEDAVEVYLRLGESDVAARSDGRYETAIELFEKAAELMKRLGKSREFEAHFDALRQRFKAKRNLRKQAEARRKFLYLS
jgi:uncharacterized Zn finger protein